MKKPIKTLKRYLRYKNGKKAPQEIVEAIFREMGRYASYAEAGARTFSVKYGGDNEAAQGAAAIIMAIMAITSEAEKMDLDEKNIDKMWYMSKYFENETFRLIINAFFIGIGLAIMQEMRFADAEKKE